jgi:hypothetical protein
MPLENPDQLHLRAAHGYIALAFLIAASSASVAAQHAPNAQPFQRLDGCIYKPQR